jgi:hypothetical protein
MAFVRTPMQDWANLVQYFPANMWDALGAQSTPANQKLHLLVDHLIKLGLRWPSEPTCQMIASLYLLCSEEPAQAFSMSPQMKYEVFRAVKKTLKVQMAKAGVPPVICVKLPLDPQEFLADFKELWDAAFSRNSTGLPIPSKVPHIDLHRIIVDMPMRSSSFGSRDVGVPRRWSSQPDSSPQVSQVMQQIQNQMTQFQSITMAALQHFGAQPHRSWFQSPGVQLQFPADPSFQRASQALLPIEPPANQPPVLQRLQSRLQDATVTQTDVEEEPRQAEAHDHQKQEATRKKSVNEVAAALMNSFDSKTTAQKDAKEEDVKGNKGKKSKKTIGKEVQPKSITLPSQKYPTVSHESTRSQYMCRTGMPGKGQTKAFKYDGAKGSQQKAKVAADKWLAEQMRTRGLK